MNPRLLLLLQIPASLLIIAFMPTNFGKLAAFLVLWVLTFKKLSKLDFIFYTCVCIFFTAMNAASLKQGIFSFSDPDVLGMPIYEVFMWGFYLLHLKRVLGGPAPTGNRATVWLLALSFAIAFAAIPDAKILTIVTGILLIAGLILYHEPLDFSYTIYFIIFGAAIEYVGVHSGQWFYPGAPIGGVPVWFITLWGGVGLLMRRLLMPILIKHENSAN
ncbi:hypothetical protein os1_07050 [Comamonadaceae bacterium OS-1]|nr:hypothetical protein os1_07050 [Comamonadaceae bacterium OS-1]